ncbi:MAG TPA: alpha/beta hydrolase fold domain-containing protein [Steroidobacteraceae bacterium]|nr:alpha/beta hydrolase fold domain-containing protein [Steroidobacteraceae bacterium]
MAAEAAKRPTFAADGTVHVPAFDLPPSEYSSPEAVQMMKYRAVMPIPQTDLTMDAKAMRAGLDQMMAPMIEQSKSRYPVTITTEKIAGVRTDIVVPKDGVADDSRVLINLHGGAFMSCAVTCGLVESIPIAGVGKIKVVSVDYRQGPEHRFPAASEDVEKVYRALLKQYKPQNIGLYGCSAGGMLTAESMAWFQKKRLPAPAAIGIFGAAAGRVGHGDSAYVSAYIDGIFPPPPMAPLSYFEGASYDDPLVSPVLHPDVLAKFPPTLIITGGRAMDFSGSIDTHAKLLKAGVDSNLLVGEGLSHCYIYNSNLPEARDAYDVIVKFFNKHLGKS